MFFVIFHGHFISQAASYLVIGNIEIGLKISWHDKESEEDGEEDKVESHGLKHLRRHQRLLHSLVEVDSQRIPGQRPDPESCQQQRSNKPNVIDEVGSVTFSAVSQHVPVHPRYT